MSRFDGVRFTNFDDRNTPEMKESEVWALTEGDDESVWIGTFGGGIGRFKDGTYTAFTTANGLVNDFVTTLHTSPDGSIWIGTDGGLSRFKDGRFTNYTVKDGLSHNTVRAIYHRSRRHAVDRHPVEGGLNVIKDGRIAAAAFDGPRPRAEIAAIYRDREGVLWVGTFDGLFRIKDGTAEALGRRTTACRLARCASSPRIPAATSGSAPRTASPSARARRSRATNWATVRPRARS